MSEKNTMTCYSVAEAKILLQQGALLAYPTESVFGLGCGVQHQQTIKRLQTLKSRHTDQGFIMVINDWHSVIDWLADPKPCFQLPTSPERPTTYVVPASAQAPVWLCRMPAHTLAIRCTTFAPLRDLIAACGPLISTSANLRGEAPCCSVDEVIATLGHAIDGVVVGDVGTASKPSQMIDITTGKVLRS